MKWTTRLVALAAAMLLISPNVASALVWYSRPPASANYAPRTLNTMATRTAAAETTDTSTSAVELELLRLTNQERVKRGLSPLAADATLASLARMKSSDMQAKNYFSHTSPTYGTPAEMLARYGVSYRSYAENIAKGADATRIHAMWMNSSGHRANILDAQLTRIGVGVAPGPMGYAATQLFIAQ